MNAYTSKEELALLPANRISFPEHYADAHNQRPGVFAALSRRLRAFAERQRVLGELSTLTDRELTDIGLTRADLSRVFDPTFGPSR